MAANTTSEDMIRARAFYDRMSTISDVTPACAAFMNFAKFAFGSPVRSKISKIEVSRIASGSTWLWRAPNAFISTTCNSGVIRTHPTFTDENIRRNIVSARRCVLGDGEDRISLVVEEALTRGWQQLVRC